MARDKFVLHRHDKIDGLSLKRSSRLRGFALRQIRYTCATGSKLQRTTTYDFT